MLSLMCIMAEFEERICVAPRASGLLYAACADLSSAHGPSLLSALVLPPT